MRLIAHISDLHFGRHNPAVAEGLLKALSHAHPDIVAVSGDLTQRARSREFAAARAFLNRLDAPVLAVPGNHDVPLYDVFARLLRPLSSYGRVISADRQPVFVDEEIAVIGLNTARRLTGTNGRISREQIAQVRAVTTSLAGPVFKILVSHHPLTLPPERHDLPPVRGAQRALEAMALAGINLLLAGHYHHSVSFQFSIECPTVSRSILVVQAGTAISTRLRGGPNSFNLISIASGEVTCVPCVWNGGDFVPVEASRFSLTGRTWYKQGLASVDPRPRATSVEAPRS